MTDYTLLIDGQAVAGTGTIGVVNPATEEVFAQCPIASEDQLNQAVAAAKRAFRTWSATSIEERQAVLNAIADAIEPHVDALARLLTQEQGKPIGNAKMEAGRLAATLRSASAIKLEGRSVETQDGRRFEVRRRPLGVVAAIVPWNVPLGLMANKIAAALITGNTVVVKPAPTTPLSTLLFGQLVKDAVPAGVLNIIADDGALGPLLTAHPDIRKVSFTGSTATGKRVMAGAADTLKRITLELGGNDAAIVLDDADPKEAANGLFQGAFRNSGQICVAIKRAYVHESLYDEVRDELVTLCEGAIVGDGLEQGTQFGPIQNKAQYERVKELIEDARKTGTIMGDQGSLPEKGYFIRPQIVTGVTDGMRIVDEEQFGPILPMIRYDDPEDALERANASAYGLGGSVWSSDVKRAEALAARMDTGSVWVNRHPDLGPNVPFGGAKQSGFGVEMAAEGLEEFTQVQVIGGWA